MHCLKKISLYLLYYCFFSSDIDIVKIEDSTLVHENEYSHSDECFFQLQHMFWGKYGLVKTRHVGNCIGRSSIEIREGEEFEGRQWYYVVVVLYGDVTNWK